MRTNRILRLTVLVAVLAPFGCSDLTGLGDIFGGRVIAIDVSVGNAGTVAVGDTIRVTAFGRVDGVMGIFNYSRILDATWASSDATIARVEPLPPPPPEDSTSTARTLVRGMRVGSARITATSGGMTGEVTVRVVPAPVVDVATVGATN